MNLLRAITLVVGSMCAACTSPNVVADRPAEPDLGTHHRSITTTSEDAQRWFDRGLILCFAFNHDEAIRCFGKATRADPSCALAWWGIALANGPHINNSTMDPERSLAAWSALEKAIELAPRASPAERGLIAALAKRYAPTPPVDRTPFDRAYADAMRELSLELPYDADVGTLFAESMMDLRPWDLWMVDGTPQPGTEEIVKTLEAVLARHPDHPGANHLYIHAVEASTRPERAISAANRLRTLVPGAGHLVHMPAHIDVRVGRWASASLANELAMEADRASAARTPSAGFYRIYMLHNTHFLAYTSMMEGRSAAALAAARTMVESVPAEFVASAAPLIDAFMPVVLHVLVRFGRWEEILAEPEFDAGLTVSNAVRHYARGVAFTALRRFDEAEAEVRAFEAALAAVDERPSGNNPARTVLQIPHKLLLGELAFRRGRIDEGLGLLREAVAIQDSLRYDEPPDWMMPARHPLGAALLVAKRFAEARLAFREDLRQNPENGWSLFGLLACAKAANAPESQISATEARWRRAWARADVELRSPCFCQAEP